MEPEFRYCFCYSFSAAELYLEAEYNPNKLTVSYNYYSCSHKCPDWPYVFVFCSKYFLSRPVTSMCGTLVTAMDIFMVGNCNCLGDGAVKIYWRLKIVD